MLLAAEECLPLPQHLQERTPLTDAQMIHRVMFHDVMLKWAEANPALHQAVLAAARALQDLVCQMILTMT